MATAISVSGCKQSNQQRHAATDARQEEVFILNWADYVPAFAIEEFERETGIKVIYDVFDSTEALEAKLLMRTPYDVVFPPAWPVYARLLKLGVFQPLNLHLLPHAKAFDPGIIGKLQSADPGLRFGVPYLWGTTGLGIDVQAVQTMAPDAPLNSWAMVFHPQYAKNLAPGRIALLDSPMDVLQSALLYLGENPTSDNPKVWDKAVRCVMAVRPWLFAFEGSKQIENLTSGQNALIQGFSTYINMARQRTRGQRDIRYVIPKEGVMVWFDMMAIPRNAPHAANAHRFIDFLLRPAMMARISNAIRAANAVPASWPMINPDLRNDPVIFPDAATLKRIFADFLPSPALLRYLSRQWLKIKMGFSTP